MADSRFDEEMDDWEDHPGTVEALLHVDAQLHDDPMGYTTWEASGPLARLLKAATADEGSYDADAEARVVAGFNLARALEDDNFYGRPLHKSIKPRRAIGHAAVAGVLAAGALAASSGLAAAHTTVARVISDIANGLSSLGSASGQSLRPAPTITRNTPSGTEVSPDPRAIDSTGPGTSGSCPTSADASVSVSPSSNGPCGVVSHGPRGTAGATAHRHQERRTKAVGDVTGGYGSAHPATGASRGRGSHGGAGAGSPTESLGSVTKGYGSGGGSGSGERSQSGTGNRSGPGTNPGGHHHHHHHHPGNTSGGSPSGGPASPAGGSSTPTD
jgi:hypothetical protein